MADKKQKLNLGGMDLEQIVASINKEYGENTMVIAKKAKGLRVEFFSTGNEGIDFALGGGIAKNRIIQIMGPESSLKTTLAYKSIAKFQEAHPKGLAVLIDIEKSHDPDYCELLGVEEGRLAIVNPDSGEQAVDVLTDLTTVDVDLYAVVDSIAMMTATAEIEASADQQFMGGNAKLVNKMMRVLVSRMKRSLYSKKAPTTTVLCINQIREKVGVMFGSPETAPGGRGKDFAYSQKLTLRSGAGDKIMEKKTVQGVTREVRIAQKVRFQVTKNKVSGSQFDEGEFIYYVKPRGENKAFTFNGADMLIKFGLFYNLVKSGEKGRQSYGSIDPCQPAKFKTDLAGNEEERDNLYHEILAAIKEENDGIDNGKSLDEDEDYIEPKEEKPKFKIRIKK